MQRCLSVLQTRAVAAAAAAAAAASAANTAVLAATAVTPLANLGPASKRCTGYRPQHGAPRTCGGDGPARAAAQAPAATTMTGEGGRERHRKREVERERSRGREREREVERWGMLRLISLKLLVFDPSWTLVPFCCLVCGRFYFVALRLMAS